MVIDPNFKPPRDKFGILLSIKTDTDDIRPIFMFPLSDQDHICRIYGYCPVHHRVHEHPKPPKPLRRRRKRRGKP